jgi:hypothetical protein
MMGTKPLTYNEFCELAVQIVDAAPPGTIARLIATVEAGEWAPEPIENPVRVTNA